jgi:hypothetical protein
MARYTVAYSSFVTRLAEVETLRDLASEQESIDPIAFSPSINALCRGTIVLLSSHVEGFIKELGELTLERVHLRGVMRAAIVPQFFYHLSKDKLTELRDASQPEAIAARVFDIVARDLDLWSKVGPFPRPLSAEQFNRGFANPAFTKIKAYFKRFGYGTFTNDLAASLVANYQPTVNMVNHVVDLRNKIAHGDIAITETPADLTEMIRLIRTFCRSTDDVFARWCRGSLCTIR